VRVSTDIVGSEVCAALKNAYAVAVRIGGGLHERNGGVAGPVAHHNWEARGLCPGVSREGPVGYKNSISQPGEMVRG
jgi:hypothetical protein